MCQVKAEHRMKSVFQEMSLRVLKQLTLIEVLWQQDYRIDQGFPSGSDELDICEFSRT